MADTSFNLQQFPAGAVIIAEGGKLNTMFVLRSGELEVVRDDIVITTIRQPGTIFGEMAVLLDSPHTATVRAVVPVEVFVIPDAVHVLEQRPHLLLQIARLLAKRVANTTAALVAAERGAHLEGGLVLPQEAVARLGDPPL
ncbi:MAG: cyclic nucleotide-binding domain-containing protein [Devosia sp.]|nr:cyclic nucleotide-binding domain-containing protein [Devosia sp.]